MPPITQEEAVTEQAATRLRECQAGCRLAHLILCTRLCPLLTAVRYVNVQSVWKALRHVEFPDRHSGILPRAFCTKALQTS